MTETTPRFGLPLLVPGQAQKEMFHNEAISALECLAQPVAQTLGDAAPPGSPLPGQSWIVGPDPSDAWAGHPLSLAIWTAGGWRFVDPQPGMCLWIAHSRLWAQYIDGAWVSGAIQAVSLSIGGHQVVGSAQPAIADAVGGATIDAEARACLNGMLDALRTHGLIQR